MAHVKVVRRSMRPPEWIKLRAGWLRRRVESLRVPLSGWQIREARQVSECRYEFQDPEYRPLQKGDMMFTPDGTVFLRLEAAVPDELDGRQVWLSLKTTAEMQVKCNGRWAGGIDPNRQRVLIAEETQAGAALLIEIEGYNRSKPDDERAMTTRHLRGCRQEFSGAELVVVDPDIEAAAYDVEILVEAMGSEYIREEIRDYITQHLDAGLNLVNAEETDAEAYRAGVLALRTYLAETIFSSRQTKGFNGCGRVALVAHSHLDIAYYWRRVHAVQKNARTCLVQLRLMDRYPEFTYAHTQPFTYELLEQYYPELFEEVKQRVAEGRFELVGAMYVEPDCNVPSAESLVRQCLYGQLYYRSRFGQTVDTCWLPDVFGNSWILPQILRKAGVDYFVSNKMSTWNDTNRFPHNHFLWRGIDGTEIPACVPPTHFITWNSPDQIAENWEAFQEKEICGETLNMFGYGDGGSGATEQMLEYARRMNNVPGVPETRHVRGDEFLKDNLDGNASLPVWDDELYLEMHRGTFTTKGELKKQNRRLELMLRDAEMLAAFAARGDYPYPSEKLTKAWKLLLVNQFHDILPGTHIAPVTVDALRDYGQVRELAEDVLVSAARALGYEGEVPDTRVLVNTLNWERKGVCFVPGVDGLAGIVSQPAVSNGVTGAWVELPAIASLGSLAVTPARPVNDDEKWFALDGGLLETPHYTAKLLNDGSLDSLVDKRVDREITTPGGVLNQIAVFHDNPGVYDAWDILPNYKERPVSTSVVSPLALEDWGPVCMTFAVTLSIGASTWRQRIRFFRNDRRIEFEHDVEWCERNRLAKAVFDVNVLTRHAACDTGAGIIRRETHRNTSWQQARFEVCHHKWVDMSEADYGVALMNDSKYGISFEGNRMALSLLRGTVRPDQYADEGQHRFAYALLPHVGGPEALGVPERACEFNLPLRVFKGGQAVSSLLTVNCPNLHLLAVKRSEDGKGDVVVRFVETHGQRGRATVTVSEEIAGAEANNLLEDPDPSATPRVISDGALQIDYRPFEIITLRLQAGQ